MARHDVLELRHLSIVRRCKHKLQHPFTGSQAALANRERDLPRTLVICDGTFMLKVFAELLQISLGVRCRNLGKALNGGYIRRMFIHQLRSTICAAASSAAAMLSAVA